MPRILRFFPFLIFLFSCADEGYSLLTVLTDQKDMVLISEYFNSIQDGTRLLLIYDDYISLEDIQANEPDLIIGGDLNNGHFRKQFISLEAPEGIYPVLNEEIGDEGEIALVPLAFDLPVIVYSQELTGLPLIMDEEDLQGEGASRNIEKDERFSHMGFSPLWNSDFLYWYLRGLRITFCEDDEFEYNQEKLTSGVNAIRDWVEKSNQGLEMEKAFSQKYRYIPDYKLLQKGIIDFVPMTFSEYSRLPGKETAFLTYSWFGDGEHINPIDCLYGGIPRDSEYPDEAEAFLTWLISEQGQKALIQYKGVASPGFALFDRFSSLETTNRLHLPLVFSDKLGQKIFLDEQLGSPPREPENWSAVKKDVIRPWLEETLWENSALTLSTYYKEWQLHFID